MEYNNELLDFDFSEFKKELAVRLEEHQAVDMKRVQLNKMLNKLVTKQAKVTKRKKFVAS